MHFPSHFRKIIPISVYTADAFSFPREAHGTQGTCWEFPSIAHLQKSTAGHIFTT